MEHLWSPWRFRYVTKATAAVEGCVFCNKIVPGHDEENLVVFRGTHNFVVLNLYPYTSGHMMVVPYQHVPLLEDVDPVTAAEMIELTRQATYHLRLLYKPTGINLGMNLGESAGAGVAGHIHMHVLPRWIGDTNFMTAVGETRVMPEDLSESWRKLRAAFNPPEQPDPA
jgi:ATP adenylyltransferase